MELLQPNSWQYQHSSQADSLRIFYNKQNEQVINPINAMNSNYAPVANEELEIFDHFTIRSSVNFCATDYRDNAASHLYRIGEKCCATQR